MVFGRDVRSTERGGTDTRPRFLIGFRHLYQPLELKISHTIVSRVREAWIPPHDAEDFADGVPVQSIEKLRAGVFRFLDVPLRSRSD